MAPRVGPGWGLGRGRIVYTAMLVMAGIVLGWLSLANATSLVLGKKNPALAMRFGYPSADTEAALAFSIATSNPDAAQLPQARRLAQAALRREPVNATAAVALGMIATIERRADLSRSLIQYSERVSRRNAVAQLWMIEDQVAHGNIAGALVHYDRAMLVSPNLRPTLIPILVQASADPAIARSLSVIMARRPLWWADALGPIIFQGPAPAVTLPIVLGRMKLRPGNDAERAFLTAGMRRLADAGAFEQANALYGSAGGRAMTGGNLVRNGDFEAESPLPPFDWSLHNEAGLTATVQPRDGGGRALFLSVDQEHGGELARQLLQLKPGRYRFAALAGDVAGDEFERPQVRLTCASAGSTVAMDLRLVAANGQGAPSQVDFAIPGSGCPAQWLSISSGGSQEGTSEEPWIDEITVKPLN